MALNQYLSLQARVLGRGARFYGVDAVSLVLVFGWGVRFAARHPRGI